jgi:Tfp pilus assembly protein FimT
MKQNTSLIVDTRGAVLVEYLIVISFAGLLVAIGLASLGPRVVKIYSGQRATLYQSNP